MKKLLRNKRGAAIELAVVTMLVIFGLCMILLTVTEMTALSNKRAAATYQERIALDTIGDDYLASRRSRTQFYINRYSETAYYPMVFTLSQSGNELLVVYKRSTDKPRMALELQGAGEDSVVVRWTHAADDISAHYVLDLETSQATYVAP